MRIRTHSLRSRLAVGVVAIVLVMSALMGAASTLTLRHTLMNRLDSQLAAAAERAQMRRHPHEGADGSGGGRTVDAVPRPSASSSDSGSGSAGGSPTSSGMDDADAHVSASASPSEGLTDTDSVNGHVLPPGLDAAGQSTGTLVVVAPADPGEQGSAGSAGQSGRAGTASQGNASGSGNPSASENTHTVLAGYIDSSGCYQSLTTAQSDALLALPITGKPVSVDLHHLGSYRVLVSKDEVSGDVVVMGLSMHEDESLIRTQLAIEAALALTGAILAAWAGRVMVRRWLAPLERVAGTARKVAAQPLAHGEVSIEERVSAQDLSSSDEVGQVGAALNTLLGHVDEALTARQESETQVRQFVADASHELRTPLASIRGYTELVERAWESDSPTPEQQAQIRQALERVHAESLRMTGLVEDLLLLARLDAGRELRRDEVDLVGIMVDSVADARAADPDHVWELDLSTLPEDEGEEEPALPIVEGDEERLRQVVANLLTNARVHTPAGTRVMARLRHELGENAPIWAIDVADNGPGIDPAVRGRMFERFARGDASRDRATGSTGLGLSIAQAIVRSHGGTISVDSVSADAEPCHGPGTSPESVAGSGGAVQTGTTFTVRLPGI